MADSAISGLDPTPQNLNDSDITIISQNVNGAWVSVKMTLVQLKTFIRFDLDIPSIFGLTEAIASKANTTHNHAIGDITGLTTALNNKASTSDISVLTTALNNKASIVHSHGMSDITGLTAALDGKANTAHSHAIGDITGLTATLNNKFDADKLGVPNGAAPLDADGLIPNNLLPAVFRWIILENDYSDFPQTGTEGVLYIDKTSNITYRWNGSAYIPLSGDVTQVTLGDGINQAYPGNKGKIAYDHSQSDHAPADAQKNSDITRQEIEEKLIGDIGSHGHSIGKISGLTAALNDKAPTTHTHEISSITNLQNQLNSKSLVGHNHPEITASSIMLVGFEVSSMPTRVTAGDSTQLAIEKLQRQVDLLSGFTQNIFEPSEDFPFIQTDGMLYLFSSGAITDTQSSQNITLAPGYYRIIAGAAAELEPGVVDTDGKWTRVFKASNSSEVYVSQETYGRNILAVGEYQSAGNPGFGNFGGVGYASNVVFPYLFKHIEELHRGVNGSGGVKGTQSGAVSVSQPIIVTTPLDVTLLIGANIIGATDAQAGFVWIRELSNGSVTVPNQFELTNGIYDGTTLGWDGVGVIEVSPDTFNGYRALRPNLQNDVITYTIPNLGTPTDDVIYNLGLQSEDGVIKFIEIVYTSAAGGSLTVKENGVDLFGELFATLPLNIQIRKLGDMIFEIIINDDGPTVVNRKIIFTDGEVENKFYLEGLFVDEVDVKPSLVQVESIRDPDGQWFNSGTVVDFVNKVLYWDRVHQLNIGSSGSPIMVPQYSSSRIITTDEFVEFNTETFDENGVKSIDFYLATITDVESAKVQNKGRVSLNNVDNAGTIVTTLTNFVTGEIELIDSDALVIDKIKFTRTSDTEVLVEYYEDATAVSNIFTIEEGAIFIIVEVKTSTGVEIINLPFDFGNV